jgi:hypothetical protein
MKTSRTWAQEEWSTSGVNVWSRLTSDTVIANSSRPAIFNIASLAISRARTRHAANDVNTTLEIIAVEPSDTEVIFWSD